MTSPIESPAGELPADGQAFVDQTSTENVVNEQGFNRPVDRPQYGLKSLLLTMTLVACLLAALRWYPGLGIALIMFVTPAFVRASVVAVQTQRRGESVDAVQKLHMLLASLGLVIMTSMAVGLAFYVTCWGGFLVGAFAATIVGARGDYAFLAWGLCGGIFGGAIGQIAYAIFFVRWFRRQRVDQYNRLGDIGFILAWAGCAWGFTLVILRLSSDLPIDYFEAALWGLTGVPGLVISAIALRRVPRAIACLGLGLGLASVATSCVYMLALIVAPDRRFEGSVIAFACAVTLSLIVLIASTITAYRWHRSEPGNDASQSGTERLS